ncbi:branched-chain amino acid aminotransferase II [Aureobasidium sp. EXF-8845]|nr:branched-chain amino acid aminotransferase II [Aureobasidium sp. EXF-8845]KAI4857371.1 branched-chain amino acid aminotransferase II [Aureobasidium sp. EXF-8846]
MGAQDMTPPASGTATPTAKSLTKAGIEHNLASNAQTAHLDASKLKINKTSAPRDPPAAGSEELKRMRTCTDHMLTARWTLEDGWEAPEIKAYGPLSIMPTASVLHYATECFEGLKLYHGEDGKLRLFRVRRNCERLRRSAARISLPDFPADQLEILIKKLCALDGPKWLPNKGGFLYLRPTFIGTDPGLGVQVPKEALLYVIIAVFPDWSDPRNLPAPSAVNPDLSEAVTKAQGLKLLASKEDSIRAWPGGFGYAKLGANYGPSLVGQGEARARGYDQILWLFGNNASVTEAGASNFFVVWKTKEGQQQLITAPLEDNLILEGVTRASVLQIAQERLSTENASKYDVESLEVIERKFTMQEILDAYEDGRLIEAFAAGTAFFVAPVGLIGWKQHELEIPLAEGKTGIYAKLVRSWLSDIMYGNEQHEWGIIVDEA